MSKTSPATGNSDLALASADLPSLYHAATKMAARGRRRLFAGTWARLSLALFVATVAAVWATGGQPTDWAAIISALGLVVTLLFDFTLMQLHPELDWIEGSGLADSVRSLAWRFAVCADPFPAPHLRVEQEYSTRMDAYRHLASNLGVTPSRTALVTERMRELRRLPLEERRAVYIEGRLADLRQHYGRSADKHGRWATRWRVIVLAAEASGVSLAVLRAVDVLQLNLFGVAGTVMAAATAWLSTRRHTELNRAYSAAAQEVDALETTLRDVDDEIDWARAVASAEDAIGRVDAAARHR